MTFTSNSCVAGRIDSPVLGDEKLGVADFPKKQRLAKANPMPKWMIKAEEGGAVWAAS
jgi:hypothetical protein